MIINISLMISSMGGSPVLGVCSKISKLDYVYFILPSQSTFDYAIGSK
jgi:hypothetical protein